MASKRLTVVESGKQSQIESEDTTLDFLSIKVGANKLEISQLDADTVTLNGKKLRAAAGTDDADFATKGQVDAADTALQDQIDTHETRLDAIDVLDGEQDDRLDTAENDIDDLESSLAIIAANNPAFETLVSAGQTVFTATTLAFAADNAVLDIEVFINGRKYDVDGTGVKNWKKTSTTAILFADAVPADAEVTIWKQGTATLVSGGGSDLANVTVDTKPAVSGAVALGSITRGWQSVFLKDKMNADVYEIEIINGVLQATLVS